MREMYHIGDQERGSFEPRKGHLTSIERDGQWVCSKKVRLLIWSSPWKRIL